MRGIFQLVAAVVGLAVVGYLAYDDAWPFDERDRRIGANPSLWELIFADGPTRSFAQLILAAFALYVVASVGALVVGGRWLRGFGTSGISSDEARKGGHRDTGGARKVRA